MFKSAILLIDTIIYKIIKKKKINLSKNRFFFHFGSNQFIFENHPSLPRATTLRGFNIVRYFYSNVMEKTNSFRTIEDADERGHVGKTPLCTTDFTNGGGGGRLK